MSDFERLKHEGRLAEAERQIDELRLRLDGLRRVIRDELDPFESVENIHGNQVANAALDFVRLQMELKSLLGQAAAILRALGRG